MIWQRVKAVAQHAHDRLMRFREGARHWSTRRRWFVFVALPLALCCCGSVVTVPVVWFMRETVAAGQGQPSPEAAANVYLTALSTGNEDGLLPVLVDDRSEELLGQWRAYRTEMKRTDPAPSKLEFSFDGVSRTSEGRAVIAVELYPVWWSHGGRAGTSLNGSRHQWQVTVREDDGWRVESVVPHAWCGGYVRADACN